MAGKFIGCIRKINLSYLSIPLPLLHLIIPSVRKVFLKQMLIRRPHIYLLYMEIWSQNWMELTQECSEQHLMYPGKCA